MTRESDQIAGLPARRAALGLLASVLQEGQLLAQSNVPGTPNPADRARAQRLAEGVLRAMGPLDKRLDPFLRKSPPGPVRNILRLAALELAEGAAPHGVVNAAVTLAREGMKTRAAAGMVNAVLRQLPETPLPTTPQHLPRWIREPLVRAHGREVVAAIEAAHARPAPLDLTPRPGATDLPEGQLLPNSSLRLSDPGQVSELPGYASGQFWVQDAAASLPARLLAPGPGDEVLDLCAAPGGKTLQMAATGAKVTALDISPARLRRLTENLARTGLSAEVVEADALHWIPAQKYDAILLDAPCTATGTLRRHPDLPFVKDGSDLAALLPLQAALLNRALNWLKPGGRLVYATCSLLAAEGEDQIKACLTEHVGLNVMPARLPGLPPEWTAPEGYLRTRPDYWAEWGGMDGFFMALLTRDPA